MSETRTIYLPREDAIKRTVRAQRVTTYLAGLSAAKAWEVIVRPFKRSRTSQQNRYERGVCCVLLAKAIGYEPEEIHEYLCGEYWGWKTKACPKTPNNPLGIKDIPVRTTTMNEAGERDVLNKQDYWDFVAFIQRFGAQYGITIPDPDPEWWLRNEVRAA